MITCKSVSKLLLADEVARLSWWRRVEVWMHLAICDACMRFKRQLEQMGAAARAGRAGDEAEAGLEERVIRRLQGK